MLTKIQTVFKLEGKSRDYALSIARYLDKKYGHETTPPLKEGETDSPLKESYEGLGQLSPVIRIRHYDEGYPRAYLSRPMVCAHPFHNDQFYMYAPVGYNGDIFKPADAIELNEEDAEKIGQGLFAGGWCDPAYLLVSQDSGTAIPSDYDPETSFHYTLNTGIQQPDRKYVFFKPIKDSPTSSLLDKDGQLVTLFNDTNTLPNIDLSAPAAAIDWIDKCLKPDLTKPIIRNFEQGPVLVYRCDDPSNFTFCPEGFEQMSPAEFQWMDAHNSDINLHIVPPPHPSTAAPKQLREDSCNPLPH